MSKPMNFAEVRKLRRGVDANEIFLFPFLEKEDIKIKVRVLTVNELIDCQDAGRSKAKENLEIATEGDLNDYIASEILYTCISTEDNEPFFSKPDDVLELSREEINRLLEYYQEVQDKYSPDISFKSEEEFESLIAEVKKKSPVGMSLSTNTLKLLVQYLVENTTKSQNDNESTSTALKQKESDTKRKPRASFKLQPADE